MPESYSPEYFQNDREEKKLKDLETKHPDVMGVIRQLQNPQLSKSVFFKFVRDFNDQATNREYAGLYDELSWRVEGVPTRKIKVKWFQNGAVSISGADFGE